MTIPIKDQVASRQFLESTFPTVAIGARLVPGMDVANLSGCNKDIDTASLPETMWPGSNLYPWPTSQFTAYVASDDPNDASPSGSGARTVLVSGLDVNYVKRTELFTMNGVGDVASAYSDWWRINSAIVISAGATGHNEGTINIKDGAGVSTVLGIIDPTMGVTQQGTYTNDASTNATLLGGSIYLLKAGTATEMQVALFARVENGPWFSGIAASVRANGSSAFDPKLIIPRTMPPKSDFDIRILFCDSNNVRANMFMQILLVDTDIFTLETSF